MTVYECLKNGSIEPLQAYLDDSEAEEFFTIKWTFVESTGAPVLLVAGKLGVVRVFDCNKQALLWVSVLANPPVCPQCPTASDHVRTCRQQSAMAKQSTTLQSTPTDQICS